MQDLFFKLSSQIMTRAKSGEKLPMSNSLRFSRMVSWNKTYNTAEEFGQVRLINSFIEVRE